MDAFKVTEHGETLGFKVEGNAGRYGDQLHVGQLVSFDDGSFGVIDDIGSRIHTGRLPGMSSFVFVCIEKEEE